MSKKQQGTARGKRPRARIPLPRKTEKRHGDASKFDRSTEKRRLRQDLERE